MSKPEMKTQETPNGKKSTSIFDTLQAYIQNALRLIAGRLRNLLKLPWRKLLAWVGVVFTISGGLLLWFGGSSSNKIAKNSGKSQTFPIVAASPENLVEPSQPSPQTPLSDSEMGRRRAKTFYRIMNDREIIRYLLTNYNSSKEEIKQKLNDSYEISYPKFGYHPLDSTDATTIDQIADLLFDRNHEKYFDRRDTFQNKINATEPVVSKDPSQNPTAVRPTVAGSDISALKDVLYRRILRSNTGFILLLVGVGLMVPYLMTNSNSNSQKIFHEDLNKIINHLTDIKVLISDIDFLNSNRKLQEEKKKDLRTLLGGLRVSINRARNKKILDESQEAHFSDLLEKIKKIMDELTSSTPSSQYIWPEKSLVSILLQGDKVSKVAHAILEPQNNKISHRMKLILEDMQDYINFLRERVIEAKVIIGDDDWNNFREALKRDNSEFKGIEVDKEFRISLETEDDIEREFDRCIEYQKAITLMFAMTWQAVKTKALNNDKTNTPNVEDASPSQPEITNETGVPSPVQNNQATIAEQPPTALEKEDLSAKVSTLETQNKELTAKVGTLETQKEGLSAKVGTLETQKEGLSAKVSTLETQNKELTAKVGTLETQKEGLSAKVDTILNKRPESSLEFPIKQASKTGRCEEIIRFLDSDFDLPKSLDGQIERLMLLCDNIRHQNITALTDVKNLPWIDTFVFEEITTSWGNSLQTSTVADDKDNEALRSLVISLRTEMRRELQSLGLTPIIPTIDTPYDPQRHEYEEKGGVITVSDPTQHNKVIECKRIGFDYNGKVLRKAWVKISVCTNQSTPSSAPIRRLLPPVSSPSFPPTLLPTNENVAYTEDQNEGKITEPELSPVQDSPVDAVPPTAIVSSSPPNTPEERRNKIAGAAGVDPSKLS